MWLFDICSSRYSILRWGVASEYVEKKDMEGSDSLVEKEGDIGHKMFSVRRDWKIGFGTMRDDEYGQIVGDQA